MNVATTRRKIEWEHGEVESGVTGKRMCSKQTQDEERCCNLLSTRHTWPYRTRDNTNRHLMQTPRLVYGHIGCLVAGWAIFPELYHLIFHVSYERLEENSAHMSTQQFNFVNLRRYGQIWKIWSRGWRHLKRRVLGSRPPFVSPPSCLCPFIALY